MRQDTNGECDHQPRRGDESDNGPGRDQNGVLTATEAKRWFEESGISVAEWAMEHGFSVAMTRLILRGGRRCVRGQSHHIAVALGMKVDPQRGKTHSSESKNKEKPMSP